MAVQSTFYDIDSIPARVFSSTKTIASKSHVAVFVQDTVGGSYSIVNTTEWELINNSVVFSENVSGYMLEIRVADSPNELETSPSDIAVVSSISEEVAIVAGINEDVSAVAEIDDYVGIVAGYISNVNAVAGSISDVNTVSDYIDKVNINADNIASIIVNSDNIADINVVAGSISDVNDAYGNALNAKEYATNPEDDTVYDWVNEVETSDYSAKHWSIKAQTFAAGLNLPALVGGDEYSLLSVNSGATGYEHVLKTTQLVRNDQHNQSLLSFYLGEDEDIKLYDSGDNSATIRFGASGSYHSMTAYGPNGELYIDGSKVWHEGNTQEFYVDTLRYGKSYLLATSFDLNTLSVSGFYNGSGLVNAPDSDWWYITVQRHSNNDNYILQTATRLNQATPDIFIRKRLGGTWEPWKRNYIDANQTSQNGYIKFTNGLVIQWGFKANGVSSVTFPMTFPSNVFSITYTENRNASTSNGYDYVYAESTSGFATVATEPGWWIAIGN